MIRYKKTDWNKVNALKPEYFQNLENALESCISIINAIPQWVFEQKSPITLDSLNAMSKYDFNYHLIDNTAHSNQIEDRIHVYHRRSDDDLNDIRSDYENLKSSIEDMQERVSSLESKKRKRKTSEEGTENV